MTAPARKLLLQPETYRLQEEDVLPSPALLYYKDLILSNTRLMIEMAGGPERLWPHVKTHKMSDMVKLQMSLGILRFKCATIAEAEMLAQCGPKDILVAYPLTGPAVSRFVALQKKYPGPRWWALGDDLDALDELSRQCKAAGLKPNLLIDVDLGQHRTGVPLAQDAKASDSRSEGPARLEDFYEKAAALEGLSLRGLHCYDGHNTNADRAVRDQNAACYWEAAVKLETFARSKGLSCDTLIMGGTPSFPCYAEIGKAIPSGETRPYLSPGTIMVYDYSYFSQYPDMPFVPGAAILTRVVSRHPEEGLITLDLGHKAIAADPAGARGVIVGLPAEPVGQSEEHWVFRLLDGAALPAVGTAFYVIPTHICPCTALYPSVPVVAEGKIVAEWEVTARNRKLTV